MKQLVVILSVLYFASACKPCPTCASSCQACPVCPDIVAAKDRDQSTSTDTAQAPSSDDVKLPDDWFVVRVVDGDTLIVKQDLPDYPARKETIRMLNINTPEKDMPLFSEATEALKTLVRGGDVKLAFKVPDVESRDHYGRLLANVFVGDINVNLEMVRLGWSAYWTEYGKSRFHDSFVAAEVEAKSANLGIHALQPGSK